MIVADYNDHQVKIYDATGKLLAIGEPGQFSNPVSVCLDQEGNLFVAELGGHRVTMWG